MEITMEQVFEEENIHEAMEHFRNKNDSSGIDGVRISELPEYWDMNGVNIRQAICRGSYQPAVVQEVEIVSASGKRRVISKLVSVDRLLLRAVAQKLKVCIEPTFSRYSYAYQEGKGTLEAAKKVVEYLNEGYLWCAEMDIQNFFDSISLERVLTMLRDYVKEETLFLLLEKYLHCHVDRDFQIQTKQKGLLQGSPLSPLLSNMFLNRLDHDMENRELRFCRFADNINVYTKSIEEAELLLRSLREKLEEEYELTLNESKSGVYWGARRKYLGFYFVETETQGYIAKRFQRNRNTYNHWHQSVVQRIDRNYHIINDGIVTRKDFTVLFENEDGKKYLPVETMGSLNVYADVTFSSGFFEYANQKGLKVSMFDRYGNFIGNFVSAKHGSSATTMLRQACLYNASDRLQEGIIQMTENIRIMNEASSVGERMMIEARNRQQYYGCFSLIIRQEEFAFTKRTKRPPRDALNAMISFGNMCLYQRIATELYKHQLDIRIGFLHSTNNRMQSLNLDIAELFKSVIIDRTIFTLINKGMIHAVTDFEKMENGGIYLNPSGKKIFIQEYENKLYQRVTRNGEKMTYDKLIRQECRNIFRMIHFGEKYKPYKYTT